MLQESCSLVDEKVNRMRVRTVAVVLFRTGFWV